MAGIARLAGLALIALTLLLPPPGGLGPDAWRVLGVGGAMALWWLTEALPLAATALVPLVALPLAGVAPLAEVAPAYAHPLILMFLGGFLVAAALERHGLHRALAGAVLRLSGPAPGRVFAALMGASAFLSLWVSNTATAMVMAPIGAALTRPGRDRLAAALMLGIAFAASIGGMGSLIGTPPNALFAAHAGRTLGVEVGFAEWALVGMPVVLVLLPVAWVVLRAMVPRGEAALALPEPDPVTPAARRVALVAGAAVAALVLRPLLPLGALGDAGILIAAALALFALPDGQGGRLLAWADAGGLRWDVLILFGGGLALAGAIEDSGLAASMGALALQLDGWPPLLLTLAMAAGVVLLSELASNTALAAVFLPVAGAAAAALGMDPMALGAAVALAASVSFMLPVATPPNAIVFAHPAVTRGRMLAAGAPLDAIGAVLAVCVAHWLAPLMLGGGR